MNFKNCNNTTITELLFHLFHPQIQKLWQFTLKHDNFQFLLKRNIFKLSLYAKDHFPKNWEMLCSISVIMLLPQNISL